MPCQVYSWVIGSVSERRPLYGVKSDDLSAPTLGWQATASLPRPVYTKLTLCSPESFAARPSQPLSLYLSYATSPRHKQHASASCGVVSQAEVADTNVELQRSTIPESKELTTFASQIFRREMLLIMSFS